jgi:hypothetical protein
MTEISVIYVNWNTSALILESIASVKNTLIDIDYDIWVVDNASSDDSVMMLQAVYPEIHLIKNRNNVGFARANNQAMQAARGRYFLLINTDAFVTPGAITQMYNLAQGQPNAGIVGAKLFNPDGSFQASFVDFPNVFQEFLMITSLGRRFYGQAFPNHAPKPDELAQKVDYVQGACMLVRQQAYERVGGLDEGYFMYSEEVDWCFSMHQAGWDVWYQPSANIIHVGGASSKTRVMQRESDLYVSRVRYFRKNYGLLTAGLVEAMMVGLASVKYGLHAALRFGNPKRFNRMTVSPVSLYNQMRKIRF